MKAEHEFTSGVRYKEYLRTYFVATAMQGLCSNDELVIHTPPGTRHTEVVAENAVAYADALIAALNKSEDSK